MKKALSVFLMIAVAFGAFADEPVADVNVAEFSGNAAVQWGVDLDSGTTGFQNSTEVEPAEGWQQEHHRRRRVG